MNISVLCTDSGHPVYPWLERWCARYDSEHEVELVTRVDELSGGDILFLISCSEYITKEIRDRYSHSLVIHASDLPEGRGWSPMVWQILEGNMEIVVTLLEADDAIDSGAIWHKVTIQFEGHELFDELNESLFRAEIELMDYALENCLDICPQSQDETGSSYFKKRSPEDSRLNPGESIASQFELLRVCDPDRYPAFFEFRGHEYEVVIRKRLKKQR